MDKQKPIVQIENVSKSFSGIRVLENVSVDLYPGEVHCLLGENGAGKSTLIKILSGAYKPDEGRIFYEGKRLAEASPKRIHDIGIATIYQEVDLVPALNAVQNIFLGNELTGRLFIDKRAQREKAREALKLICDDIDVDCPVGQLKIAQQQMIAIARALSYDSRVMVFDEPTAVFASAEKEALFDIIRRLKAKGIAIVYITHHLDEIFEIGDRITILKNGTVTSAGLVREYDKNSLIRAMIGKEIDVSNANGVAGAGGEELLRVENLCRGTAVKNVSFAVHAGEVVGIAGLVGAGRTETARVIFGVDRAESGKIYYRGKQAKIQSPTAALRTGIGMVPEDRKSAGLLLLRAYGENMSYCYMEANVKGWIPWKTIREKTAGMVRDLNIHPGNTRLAAGRMSGGNQQKVVLGKWMMTDCDVLILDEPTRGVDVGARSEIYALIQRLKAKGKGIVMISSDTSEILSQSDRILVMASGRMVGELSCDEATEERILSLEFSEAEHAK